jgi:hypothetical protein
MPPVGPIGIAQQQEGDVRVLPGLQEVDFFVDSDRRALRITFDQIGIAGFDQLLMGHRGLQVRQTDRA